MVRVITDVITRGLNETIINLRAFPGIITQGVAKQMERWYNLRYKKTILKVIATGKPQSMIPVNVGRYAARKKRKYGISHGLGRLTGKLYNEVAAAKISIRETRGKEVRFAVAYDKPFYVAFVHEGTKFTNYRRRPFAEVAREKELPKLVDMLGRMFDGLDFTRPTQELVSTVLATR